MAKKSIQRATDEEETRCTRLMREAALCADTLSEHSGYRRGPQESHTGAHDRLIARLDAAEAMLLVATNDDFLRMAKTIQANYFTAIQDLVSSARADANLIGAMRP